MTKTDNSLLLEARLQLALGDHPRVLSVSDTIQALLGFSPADLLEGKVSPRNLIHPDDQDMAEAVFSPATNPASGSFNIRLRQANGRVRCIRGNYSKETGGDGRDVVLDLLLQDAKSLRRALGDPPMTANFRAMMENTDDFIYFKDRNHVFTGASQTLVSLTDPAEHWTDLLGQTDYDVFPEEYADVYYRLEKQVFAGIPVAREIQEYLTKDGRKGLVDNRKYPIRDDGGAVIGLFGIARDISEKVLAEEALRRERETQKLILDHAPIGIWLQDGSGKLSFVNKAFCEAMGISEERFLAAPHYAELLPEEFRAQCLASDAKALAESEISVTLQRLPFVDGRVHDLRVIKAVKRDERGEPVALVGLSLDITEELKQQQALRHERDTTRNILETVEAIIVAIDPDGRITLINRQGCKLLGYTAEELVGKNWFATCLPPTLDKDQVLEVFKKALACDLAGSEYFENPVLTRSGEERLIAWHNSTIRDKDGNVIGGLSAGEDITERKASEAAIAESRNLLLTVINTAPIRVFWKDRNSRYLGCNTTFARDAGAEDPWDIVGKTDHQLGWAAQADMYRADDREVMASGISKLYFEEPQTTPDGRTIWLRTSKVPLRDQNHETIGVLGIYEDITDRKRAEEKLHLAANVFTHAREGIMITAADGTIIDVNDAFTRITGYSGDEVRGRNPRLLSSGLHPDEFYAAMWRALMEQGHWSGEVWNRRRDGEVFAAMLTISAMRDASGSTQQYVALFTDITPIKEHARQLEHIAHFDALTGLPNRVLLADRLHQAMAQAHRRNQKLAVAYVDLDSFKAINDRHGHAIGDQVLMAVAASMRQVLREGDTLARLGGDEFVAVFMDLADSQASLPMLGRLLAAATEPLHAGELVLRVSASVGVTFYPQADEVDADQLLRQADQAMYQAKLSGKNRHHIFDAERDRSVRGHHESLEHIRLALARREFVLHFQPKVNMRTGKLIGAEALIRWQHRERGLLPPGLFLPVIEDHPLAVEVGEWVIDSALAQMEAWQASGLDIPVSVNIAARHLQQADFVDRLRALLAAHPEVKPSDLELEVVETSALEDLVQVSEVLEACRGMGVAFALDDFGTGYSSLTYLKQLAVRQLKIDQSFVHDMLDDPDDLAILEGVLGLATAFRRQVIAEGVETVEHGVMLLHLGCELAQGYGIARPMPADALPAWSAAWEPDPRWAALTPVRRNDLPLLYAGIEIRAWIMAIGAALRGERNAPPPLDPRQCRLGTWLYAEALAGRGEEPTSQVIDSLHRRLHALAATLCEERGGRLNAEDLARLSELHALRDALLERLQTFLREGRQ